MWKKLVFPCLVLAVCLRWQQNIPSVHQERKVETLDGFRGEKWLVLFRMPHLVHLLELLARHLNQRMSIKLFLAYFIAQPSTCLLCYEFDIFSLDVVTLGDLEMITEKYAHVLSCIYLLVLIIIYRK